MNTDRTQPENREDAVVRAMHAALRRRMRRRRAGRSGVVLLILVTVGTVAWRQRQSVQATHEMVHRQILLPAPALLNVEILTASAPAHVTFVQTDPTATVRATRPAERDVAVHVRLLSDEEADDLLEMTGKPRGTVRIAGRVYAGATIVRSSQGG